MQIHEYQIAPLMQFLNKLALAVFYVWANAGLSLFFFDSIQCSK